MYFHDNARNFDEENMSCHTLLHRSPCNDAFSHPHPIRAQETQERPFESMGKKGSTHESTQL